ncbi:putative autotransporter protein [Minicystis rosea]|nr:putative autotransporter protein [Minicystis rosea]
MSFWRASSIVLLLCTAIACGDEPNVGPGGGGSGGGSSGGSGGSGAAPPRCGGTVAVQDLDHGDWDHRFTIAGLTGHDGLAPTVHDFAREPDGSVIATGRFQWFEGKPVPPLVRFHDGVWEAARTTWELPAPLDGFSAIAVATNGDLALATNDSFGDRDGEIWIDEGSGLTSIASFKGQVRSLAWFDGRLWVAGVFQLDGATSVEGLATWDGSTWSAAPGGALQGSAFELLVDGDTLFIGGAFTGVGGIAAANVASYDGAVWTPFDFADAMAIYALARTEGGSLYAGGVYGDLMNAGGIARWSGSAWETVGGGLAQYDTRGVVTDLVAHGEIVDAGGCFTSAGGKPAAAGAIASRGIARWTGSAWQSFDDGSRGVIAPWFQPTVCGDEGLTAIWDVPQQRLAFDGQRLFAGGSFPGVDGVLSQALAVHDGTQWVAQGKSGIGIGGSIDFIAAGGNTCEVYGLGTFSHVAGAKAEARVVHFKGDGWDVLGDPLPKDAYCPALDVSPAGQVAVGCMVFPTDGDAQGSILVQKGDKLEPLAVDGLGPVMNLAWSSDGTLWIVGGGATGYLARLDGEKLTIVEDGFDGVVGQLHVKSADDIVVAGSFTKVGSTDATRIARWDGKAWLALGEGLPGQVLALGRDASTVYVSTYDEGNGAYVLGAFEGTSWRELATPEAGLTPQTYFSFNSIVSIDGGLLLGGTAELDDGSGRGVLVYRDGALRALGGGVGAMTVGRVAVTGDGIWVAGTIAEAGSGENHASSVGVARYQISP